VVAGASIVLAIEDSSRRGDSTRKGEEEAEKGRIILGMGAIAPDVMSSDCCTAPIT